MLHRTWSVRLGALSGYVFCGLADAYPSEDWNRAFISAREAVPSRRVVQRRPPNAEAKI